MHGAKGFHEELPSSHTMCEPIVMDCVGVNFCSLQDAAMCPIERHAVNGIN